jgi:hypothetical protein
VTSTERLLDLADALDEAKVPFLAQAKDRGDKARFRAT